MPSMTTPTTPITRLQSRLRSVLSQAKQEYELHDEIRTLNDDFPEHLSAKLECEAALELLSESVTADSFVSQDVATEYVQLLRRYRTFLEQWEWAIRARVATNLIQDIEEGCTVQRAAAWTVCRGSGFRMDRAGQETSYRIDDPARPRFQ